MLSDLRKMGRQSSFKDKKALLAVPEEFPNELLEETSEDVVDAGSKQWVSPQDWRERFKSLKK